MLARDTKFINKSSGAFLLKSTITELMLTFDRLPKIFKIFRQKPAREKSLSYRSLIYFNDTRAFLIDQSYLQCRIKCDWKDSISRAQSTREISSSSSFIAKLLENINVRNFKCKINGRIQGRLSVEMYFLKT